MKKFLTLLLAAVLTVSAFAGCSSGSGSSSSSENSGESVQLPALSEVRDQIAGIYGEDYIPSMVYEEIQLKEVMGINTDNVEEFVAEGPMMSAHVDTFIAIKAKEGKGEEVESDLNAYRDVLVEDQMMYPMNVAKVNASQVVRRGDYVFFVMLGAYPDDENLDDDAQLQFAKEEVQKAVDKLNELFPA